MGLAWSLDQTERQWIDFGIYPEACMTSPETCGTEGGAVSFWINIENFDGNYLGGIISTQNSGDGFSIFLSCKSKQTLVTF